MRKTVLVPVEYSYCDAHLAKDQSEVEATATLTLGHRAWDLCVDHRATFARYLVDALGTGVPDAVESEAEAKAESVVVAEPAPVAAEPEPVAVVEPSPVVEFEHGAEEVSEEAAEPEPVRSVMLAGEVPGYGYQSARDALRNAGYEVVGRADSTTVLFVLGERGENNATRLRDASKRGIPCFDVREPGRFKSAVLAGSFVGGDPLPEPAKVTGSGMSERERNRAVRQWARANGYTVPDRGRIPLHVRHAFELTHRDAPQGKATAA
ncbi:MULTISPECIES: histone-like nucleoid-structuring protein Lsr2 [unclassified Streptomyces]|uniref:Lsr2 family DNA-binding protein n=1 Tax=unclassified Streptomyces TaxID=2593676 RepID=UPI00382EDD0F